MARAIPALVVFALCALTLLGCGPRSEHDRYVKKIVEEYGGLRALEATANAELRAELARIVGERATPELLCRPAKPDPQNAAEALTAIIEPELVERLLKDSGALLANDRLTLGPLELEQARELIARHEKALKSWREAWKRPRCAFHVQHTAGYFADTAFIAQVRGGGRLELLAGAIDLAQGELERAAQSVATILRGAEALAAVDHVVSRLEGARMRREALYLVELAVQHRQSTSHQLTLMHGLLAAQLAAWPADAKAWIGDRALGMHAYETIRGGDLAALLTDGDVARLTESRELEHFFAASTRPLDDDELFYLRAMRSAIAACNGPMYRRYGTLREIQSQLARLEGTSEYPAVAARLLLPGIEAGMRGQTLDRAACEAWTAALAAALGKETSPPVNPLTGDLLVIEKATGQVVVQAGAASDDPWPRTIVVPIRGPASIARRPAEKQPSAPQ